MKSVGWANFCDTFPVQNDLKQGDALLPLLCIEICCYEGLSKLKLNGTHHLLICGGDLVYWVKMGIS